MAWTFGRISSLGFKQAIRLRVRAVPGQILAKSAKAATGDVLAKLHPTRSSGSPQGLRDRPVLMVTAPGTTDRGSSDRGQRRSSLPVAVHLGCTKMTTTEKTRLSI